MSFWKDKKIVAYIALSHHTRFITPVLERIARMGADTKYVVGQAERSQEITAIELGLDYCHVFEYVGRNDDETVYKNYQRLLKKFVPAIKHHFLLTTQPATVIDKTLRATATEYVGLKNLLKEEKPDLCFALHELNRWGKMLGFWSKKLNIPFVTLQEGLGYGVDFGYQGHAQYSTLSLLWGNRILKKLSSFEAPSEKILTVGNTHLAAEMKCQKEKNMRKIKRQEYGIIDATVLLLILSAKLPNPERLLPLFQKVSENNGLHLFVKFHPATRQMELDRFMHSFPEKCQNNLSFIHSQENAYDLISASDICILGHPSTTGLEALAFGKPLVKLDFAYSPNASYSFVDQQVAVKMSAEELAASLDTSIDFSEFINKKKIARFLENELADTTHAVDRVTGVLEKVISANQTKESLRLNNRSETDMDWTIVLFVPEDPDFFLVQLNAVSTHSKGQGSYETILIEPEDKTEPIKEIIDSLTGDIRHLILHKDTLATDLMNTAGQIARGRYILFLDYYLAPLPDWLFHIQKGFSQYGDHVILGARIADFNDQIVHAGMVIDQNNTPKSAYANLHIEYPPALKKRRFKLVDHFTAIEKSFFLEIGGCSRESGNYAFMDICLKAYEHKKGNNSSMYLPDLKMLFLKKHFREKRENDSVYFFGKWHGQLWESEKQLLKEDGVSRKQLDSEMISAAMTAF